MIFMRLGFNQKEPTTNTFFDVMEEKIAEFALKLKRHFESMSKLSSSQGLLEFEQRTEELFQEANRDFFDFVL